MDILDRLAAMVAFVLIAVVFFTSIDTLLSNAATRKEKPPCSCSSSCTSQQR